MTVKILLMLSVAKVFDNPLEIIGLGDCAPYCQLQCHTYFTTLHGKTHGVVDEENINFKKEEK